jgi:endonuclease/exonuclease/phosphatase family metal-dependent hydrolase
MEKIKIFTQNICFRSLGKKQRMDEIKEYIRYKKFDFAFLQEIVFKSDLKELKRKSFIYFISYIKGRIGPKGGLIILSKRKFEKIEFHKFKKQGKIFSKQIVDRLIEKGFLVGYLENFVYINTHLVCTYNEKNGKKAKALDQQFEQLLKFIKEQMKKGKKMILGGDFNFNQNSKNYKKITELLIDNTKGLRKKIKKRYPHGQIDFIFSSEKNSKDYNGPEYPLYISDHPGIEIELVPY